MLHTELPDQFGDWTGKEGMITQKEYDILAKDTDFARKSYSKYGEVGLNAVEASIVFSGKDINNSIHRPERCLRAQGWDFSKEEFIKLPVEIDGASYVIPFKKIVFFRPTFQELDGKQVPVENAEGKQVVTHRVQYYCFFGNSAVVSGHYERTYIDIRDRLLKGATQRWAYATFSMGISQSYADQGLNLGDAKGYDETMADERLAAFIKGLLPLMIEQQSHRYLPTK